MGPVEASSYLVVEFLVPLHRMLSLKGERSPGTLRSGLFLTQGASPTPRTGLVHKWRLIIPAQV
jgi:hypothetical protein